MISKSVNTFPKKIDHKLMSLNTILTYVLHDSCKNKRILENSFQV